MEAGGSLPIVAVPCVIDNGVLQSHQLQELQRAWKEGTGRSYFRNVHGVLAEWEILPQMPSQT